MQRIAVFLSVILLFAAIGAAQDARRSNGRAVRSVGNAELDRFKLKRLTAEREYRQNYAQLGFPSPEELQRQHDQDRIERQELSAKLREERLERERLAAERMRYEAEITAAYYAGRGDAAERYPYEGLRFVSEYGAFYGNNVYPYGGYGSFYGGILYPHGGFGKIYPRPRGNIYIGYPGYRGSRGHFFKGPIRNTPGRPFINGRR